MRGYCLFLVLEADFNFPEEKLPADYRYYVEPFHGAHINTGRNRYSVLDCFPFNDIVDVNKRQIHPELEHTIFLFVEF